MNGKKSVKSSQGSGDGKKYKKQPRYKFLEVAKSVKSSRGRGDGIKYENHHKAINRTSNVLL